ncbi:hypothetical protein BpHYR1_030836 [Brachionus plicatilis]|uniref:Uncharacterized protein n=1 Tax=Brachionus plicatilis TaxID=10195 RepID=A0A3M7QWI8_BRAPC|nr:hypothetical protein BpHYR1_030836 [Brachionus plicatilis]
MKGLISEKKKNAEKNAILTLVKRRYKGFIPAFSSVFSAFFTLQNAVKKLLKIDSIEAMWFIEFLIQLKNIDEFMIQTAAEGPSVSPITVTNTIVNLSHEYIEQ